MEPRGAAQPAFGLVLSGDEGYLMAGDADAAEARMRHEPMSAAVRRLDLAILSVGTMAPSSTAFRFNLISDEERAELLRLGAVGDMLFNFYDRDGKLVEHPVNRRIMSLPLEQLRSVPTRVLASGGNDKVDCLLGAIRLADANVLITNEATARELLLRKA